MFCSLLRSPRDGGLSPLRPYPRVSYRRYGRIADVGASLTFSLSLTYTRAPTRTLRACACVCARISFSPPRELLSRSRRTNVYGRGRWCAARGNGSNFVIYIGICKYRRYATHGYMCIRGPPRLRARAYAGVSRARARPVCL